MKTKGLQLPAKFKKFKPFAEQLADGDVCNLRTAAKIVGYSEQHLRRLCDGDGGSKPISHIRRNGSQLFFEPQHIEALFERRGDAVGSTTLA